MCLEFNKVSYMLRFLENAKKDRHEESNDF